MIYENIMYFIWQTAKSYPNKYWLKYDWDNNPDFLLFLENKILHINSNITFFLDKTAKIKIFMEYDFILSDAVNIFSKKLSKVVKKIAPDDIQLIEAKVFQEHNFIDNYYIPIILNKISCIDKKNSIYDKNVDNFTKISIKKNSLKEHIIIQARNYDKFIVREEFVNMCKVEKIKGIEFYKEPFIDPLYN